MKLFSWVKGDNHDQDAGIKIVLRVIEQPMRESLPTLVTMCVLDPTKVTRTALQNAASVAGLMLPTDCVIGDWLKTSRPLVACPAAWAVWVAYP